MLVYYQERALVLFLQENVGWREQLDGCHGRVPTDLSQTRGREPRGSALSGLGSPLWLAARLIPSRLWALPSAAPADSPVCPGPRLPRGHPRVCHVGVSRADMNSSL